MKKRKGLLYFFGLFFLTCVNTLVYASNVAVTNVTLTGQNATAETIQIQFDLSWDNSWRDSTNYDAIWVFAKYKKTGESEPWNHVMLKSSGTNPSGYVQGSGAALNIVVPTNDDGKSYGCFIERSVDGSGTVTATGIQIVWDWSENGSSLNAADTIDEIRVYAVEMVYMPECSFYVGSGGTESGSFTNGSWTSGATIPILVSSENAIELGASAGKLWGTSSSGDNTIGSSGTLPAGFPKGFQAFYIMKYEISQGQWVDFFNTLTDTQKATRDLTSASGKNSDSEVNRNTISWSSGDASAGTNYRVACSFLGWMDLAAYSDWAGLRPLTEIEFEKACRGPIVPVAEEKAWGSIDYTKAVGITNAGAADETSSNTGNGLCINDNHPQVPGPLRTGFAATGSTTRVQSGASYYGVMELSGNLSEHVVSVGNATGRAFMGTHGNGILSSNGNANNSDWPGYSGTEITGASGSGFRGGNWYDGLDYTKISNRTRASLTDATRTNKYGGRLVRTAP
jgi:formylglycine-generating enzyme required for sulfatase activity